MTTCGTLPLEPRMLAIAFQMEGRVFQPLRNLGMITASGTHGNNQQNHLSGLGRLSFSFFFFATWKETLHECRGDRAAPENPLCYPSRRVTTHELVQPRPPSRINREFGECCVPLPGP